MSALVCLMFGLAGFLVIFGAVLAFALLAWGIWTA